MSDISIDQLRQEILDILKDADLTKTSARNVRHKLEEQLDVKLTSRRQEIDDVIMVTLKSLVEMRKKEQEAGSSSSLDKAKTGLASKKFKKTQEEQQAEPQQTEQREVAPKRKRKAKKSKKDENWDEEKKKRNNNGAFTKLYKLSPQLAKVMGEKSMSRPQVVKRMWAVLRERGLYSNGMATCDKDLKAVIGLDEFKPFVMMKYINQHFLEMVSDE